MASESSSDDLLGRIMVGLRSMTPLLPMYLHLIVSALFPIYSGAYASLSRPSSAAPPSKNVSKDRTRLDDDDEDEPIQKMEGLTPQDAIVFPVTAGVVLAGLYWLIKTYGADLINYFLAWYFGVVGIYSVTSFVNDALAFVWGFVLPDYYLDQGKLWQVDSGKRQTTSVTNATQKRSSPLPGILGRIGLPQTLLDVFWRQRNVLKNKFIVKGYAMSIVDFELLLTRHNIFSALAATAIVIYANFFSQSWYLTNLQGFAVSYGALQLMSPTSFGTGSLILIALFAYDIWAVFFTPMMVSVATNLEVPIKLVFPRPDDARAFSMLGLGDIVIPGIMIAMALRFDLYLLYLKKQSHETSGLKIEAKEEKDTVVVKAPYIPATGNWGTKFFTRGADPDILPARLTSKFPKPYFTASLIGYTVGMVFTLVAMSISQQGQPALLYLVPCVLSSLWGTSLARRETKVMWEFSEGLDEDEADKAEAAEKEKSEKQNRSDPEDKSIWSWIMKEVLGITGISAKDDTTSNSTDKAEARPSTGKGDPTKKEVIFSFSITRPASRPSPKVATD